MRRRDRLDAFAFDLRYSLRRLRRSPGFTASVIVTLGLGLGANAAMFGLLDRLLLRPPAHVREPDQVRRVYLEILEDNRQATVTEVSLKRLTELQQNAAAGIDLAGMVRNPFIAGDGEAAREIRGIVVSPNFFPMLGVRPHLGRFLDAGDAGAQEVVLGFDWWRSVYGSDSTIIGRTLRIGTGRFTMVGVAPPGYTGVDVSTSDAWISATAARAIWTHLGPEWTRQHSFSFLSLVGRLRDGVSESQAADRLGAAYRQSLETQGGDAAVGAARAGAKHSVSQRRREFGVRVALGARSTGIIGMVLGQGLRFAIMGLAIGLAIALATGGQLTPLLLGVGPRDPLVALGVAVELGVTTILAGLIPAWRASRVDPADALRSE